MKILEYIDFRLYKKFDKVLKKENIIDESAYINYCSIKTMPNDKIRIECFIHPGDFYVPAIGFVPAITYLYPKEFTLMELIQFISEE